MYHLLQHCSPRSLPPLHSFEQTRRSSQQRQGKHPCKANPITIAKNRMRLNMHPMPPALTTCSSRRASSLKRFSARPPTSLGKPHIHIYQREANAVDAHQLSDRSHASLPEAPDINTSEIPSRDQGRASSSSWAVVTRTRKLSDSSVWRLCQCSAPASEWQDLLALFDRLRASFAT